MLRNRDVVAAVLALVLTRMAWNDQVENLSAGIHLAFYFPLQKQQVSPAAFDVDEDGVSEALVTVLPLPTGEYVVQLLDLKPLHHRSSLAAPFQPPELLRSEPMSSSEAKPLQLVTGQVMIRGYVTKQPTEDKDERTRHYFCGTDWHHAATTCGTPCPSEQDKYHLTPAGGLPSCFTLWDNGSVTLHSLTSPKDDSEKIAKPVNQNWTLSASALLKKSLQKQSPLKFQNLWTTKALASLDTKLSPHRVHLTFLDAFDATKDAPHGMLLVSGDLPKAPTEGIQPPVDPMTVPRFVVALDALTGEVLWDSLQNFLPSPEEPVLLPVSLQRGTTSMARRRSKVAQLNEHNGHGVLPNCWTGYRYSLLGATDVLPYAYWGPADAGIRAVHLDPSNTQRKFHRHEQHHAHKHPTPLASSSSSSQNHQPGQTSPHHHRHLTKKSSSTKPSSALLNPRKQQHHGHVHYGRPNVIVHYYAGGLQVHSLQNGQPLCRLGLLEEVLYVDLQRDGQMDSIQVITAGKNLVIDPTTGKYADEWVEKLAMKVTEAENRNKDAPRTYHHASKLCHALALSGLPAREELFSTPLCGTSGNKLLDSHAPESAWRPIHAAPPLVVESLYPQHRHREKDVIFAMSNGVVSRVRGGTGRRQWKLQGNKEEHFPSWGHWEATNTVSLTRLRVDDLQVAPYARPILLVGESSIALLSATTGQILALTNVPQRSLRRPILADVSGDGVTDVLILSADAVWGYQVIVRTGASIFFRILVGLLPSIIVDCCVAQLRLLQVYAMLGCCKIQRSQKMSWL